MRRERAEHGARAWGGPSSAYRTRTIIPRSTVPLEIVIRKSPHPFTSARIRCPAARFCPASYASRDPLPRVLPPTRCSANLTTQPLQADSLGRHADVHDRNSVSNRDELVSSKPGAWSLEPGASCLGRHRHRHRRSGALGRGVDGAETAGAGRYVGARGLVVRAIDSNRIETGWRCGISATRGAAGGSARVCVSRVR